MSHRRRIRVRITPLFLSLTLTRLYYLSLPHLSTLTQTRVRCQVMYRPQWLAWDFLGSAPASDQLLSTFLTPFEHLAWFIEPLVALYYYHPPLPSSSI